jgi:acyl-CoA hydrolase
MSVMETYIVNRWEVQPNHANNQGTAHGGNVMKWMDGTGGLSAMRFAEETCITARMDRVNFQHPIPTGQTALVESYAVYVAIDEDTEPVPVPDVEVTTQQGRELRAAAQDDDASDRTEPLPRGAS